MPLSPKCDRFGFYEKIEWPYLLVVPSVRRSLNSHQTDRPTEGQSFDPGIPLN
ncbi:MAG: hypothetical protein ACRCU2_04905 [Planktothrix sp.]